MKEFLKKNLEIKIVATLFFTAQVIVYTLIAPFIGQNSISLFLIWQMVFISIMLTILQYLIYATSICEKMNNGLKIGFHYIILLVFGYFWARGFNWFDVNNINNILISISIFTVCFTAFSGSIAVYNKLTGDKLNEKLRVYKNNKKSEE